MKKTPEISVVMSVYKGAEHLRESVESILSQEGVDLEFIIINDGSTDDSGSILDEYAERDNRVRVIHQENKGLTNALIWGCAEARGKYIARQDAGDISLPRRLQKQLLCMKSHGNAALVSCGTRFVGPRGEHLYDSGQNPAEATDRLLTLDLKTIRGPSHHGSTFFSRDLYGQVGGYRPSFYFAQDLDLWLRLVEHGKYFVIPDVLYEASITVESISGLNREDQIQLAKIILEGARLRRRGMSDVPALEKATAIKPSAGRSPSRLGRAKALYFIGMCLRMRNNVEAKIYFREAVNIFPLHFKSLIRLLF
jgi:glycosyltransferase involved in cell wall biosynthesis